MDDDEIREKAAITELLHHYEVAITVGDFKAWSECFTDDGVFVTDGRDRGMIERFDAHQDLERFEGLAQKIIDATPNRRAHLTTVEIELADDRANARCYVFSTATGEDSRTKINGSGEYNDRLIKLDGRWMFQERSFHQDGV